MLLAYEIIKIVRQKMFLVLIGCSTLLVICMYVVVLQSNGYYEMDNTYQTGIKEAQKLSRQRHALNGILNDKVVQNIGEQFQKGTEYDEKNVLNIKLGAHKWQKYNPLFDVLIRTYSSIQNSDYHSFEEIALSDIHAADIISARNKQLEYIKTMQKSKKPYYNKQEKNMIDKAKFHPSKTIHYEDATGWNILFSKLIIINMMVCVISALIGSTLFSKEVRMESAAIIYTTKNGRTKGIIYKYIASMCLVSAITIFFQCLFAGMILSTYSFSGMHTLIQYQAMYWLSIFPFTNLQAYVFIVALGFLASMSMLCISILCSRYTKKEYYALILSLLYLFIPMILSHTFQIFPYDMCNGNIQLLMIHFYRVYFTSLYMYQFQFLFFLLSVGVLVYIYQSFQKRSIHMIQ